MNMSFALTTPQVRRREKRVTRRMGWTKARAGQQVQPIVKGQGLRKGEKVEYVGGPIVFVNVRRERLRMMLDDLEYGQREVELEGFKGDPVKGTPQGFVDFFCATHGCTVNDLVTRIEFSYVD